MGKLCTVVIPTYKRDIYLKNLLLKLNEQTNKNFDVLVGYQGKNRDFSQFLQSLSLKPRVLARGNSYIIDTKIFDYSCKVVYFDIPSITKTKNALIGIVKSKYILTLDDDVVPDNNLINEHFKRIEDISGGFVIEDIKVTAIGKIYGNLVKKFVKPGYFDVFGELNINFRDIKSGYVQAVKGGNMMFKRQVWEKIEGFDETYTGNAINEDNDFCLRAYKSGFKIFFNKTAVVKHIIARGGSRGRGTKTSAIWYEDLFKHHLYFFLTNFKKSLVWLFFLYRLRQVYTCWFKYGKLSKEYVLAPFIGYYRGLKSYYGKDN